MKFWPERNGLWSIQFIVARISEPCAYLPRDSLANLTLPHRSQIHKLRGHFSQNFRRRWPMPIRRSNIETYSSTLLLLLFVLLPFAFSSCRAFREPTSPSLCGEQEVPNPLVISLMDREYVMDQISDELDDYFEIYREERIRIVDNVMSEGWIETHPTIGGTILEPWKKDSTRGFERLHATLQTVRRFAKVRVIPTGNSYQIDVKVFKELEDLPQPIGAAVGGPLLRHDNALDVDQPEPGTTPISPGWIPMGRDFSLEQQILRNIQQRFARGVE